MTNEGSENSSPLHDARPPSYPTEDAEALVGTELAGRFRVESVLGMGGMCAVFRAYDPERAHPVALKILAPSLARSEEARERFTREAKIAQSLTHPNVATVYEIAELPDGRPFQVLELCEGSTLAQHLSVRGGLEPELVLSIGAQVLSALSTAHQAGIVHRDLKPENIMLVRSGQRILAKLLDFGMSKGVDDNTLTAPGMVVGTPYYLSPELATGSATSEAQGDLWAMGVVLYEALTGVPPFRGDTYEALVEAIIAGEPMAPSSLRAELNGAVEALVMKALEKLPDHRFKNAEELLEATTRILNSLDDTTVEEMPAFDPNDLADLTLEQPVDDIEELLADKTDAEGIRIPVSDDRDLGES